jgi:RND family efflux transporter MFP subunit
VATLSQVEDATTAAEVAHADLNAASVNRRYAVIVAPSSGPILRRTAEPGELVAPGAAVLELGSRASGVVLRVGLADRDVVRLRVGDRATVRFDAFPDRVVNGAVRQIGAASSAATGTYSVEVALDDPSGLASGMAGHVEIATSRGRAAALVPVQAVVEADGDHATVFALDSTNHARRISVEIGALQNGRVPVRRGLEHVRAVVTDGASYLDNGTLVRIVP